MLPICVVVGMHRCVAVVPAAIGPIFRINGGTPFGELRMIIDYAFVVLRPCQILGSQSNFVQIVVVGGCSQRQDGYGCLIDLWAVAGDGAIVLLIIRVTVLPGEYEFNASRNCRVGLRYLAVHQTPYRQTSHTHTW